MELISSTLVRNGKTYYTLQPKNPQPSEWQDLVEGAKKEQLSQEELQSLKDKYDMSDMSEADQKLLLKELVQAGIISKQTASCIGSELIPIGNIDDIGQGPSPRMVRSTAESERWRTSLNELKGRQSTGQDWLDYYSAFYHVSKNETALNPEESEYFQEYANYLKIMEQLVR